MGFCGWQAEEWEQNYCQKSRKLHDDTLFSVQLCAVGLSWSHIFFEEGFLCPMRKEVDL